MKWLAVSVLLFCFAVLQAQPLIHAHNDYKRNEPLTNALRNKVFSIEVDIFLVGKRILVAHDTAELATASTLDSFYLQPIIQLFRKHKGTISEDTAYSPILMIDIKEKENVEPAIAALIKLLSAHPSVFDRSVNAKAVQLVISGNRGASSKWTSYPPYIFFDGRPKENYDSNTLQRVAFISDSYYNYAGKQEISFIEPLVKKVHSMGKLLRLWGNPDNPGSWKLLHQQGVDIINTDKVEECSDYFNQEK